MFHNYSSEFHLFLFSPVVAVSGGPPAGLNVKVINEQPIPVTGDIGATVNVNVTVTNGESNPVPVTGGVQFTNAPDINVVKDGTNPVPVVLQNAGTATVRQSLLSAGAGGRTIAGRGYINFTDNNSNNAIIFSVQTPIVIYACVTGQNVGQTPIIFANPVTFSISQGTTDTYCRKFSGANHGESYIAIEASSQGVGEFLYRVDLISDVSGN